MKPPNILWICTDQQRFDTLGCYDNPFVHTPNLDRLARQGVVFEHCYTQNPVCTPSRASFLTGRYPRTTRCRQNGQSIPSNERTITRLLADADYTCGMSGKLHLSACHPTVCKTTERRIDDGYAEFHWSHGPREAWVTDEYFHWLREKGVRLERKPVPGSKYVQVSDVAAEHHAVSWCAQKAINLIEAHASMDRPWLFSVNPHDPHHPFDPPIEYLERYLPLVDDIPLPNYRSGELEVKPIFQKTDHCGAYNHPGLYPYPDMSDTDHRLIRAAYWATIDLIDEQVGRMLEALERTGQLEKTFVIFMSDHGEMLGDHGIYLKGPYFYDPGVRVPLIISWPGGIEGGRRSQAMVELVDIAPTLLDAAGLDRDPGMQGRSLWPILSGQANLDVHRDDVYCEYYNANFRHDPLGYATMVRTRRHKLVAVHGMDCGELYDLEQDPNETQNHWDDPAYQGVKVEMLKRLCDRMAWTIDPLPQRKSPW